MADSRIVGDDELRAKLAKLKDLKALVPVLEAAALKVSGEASKYPDLSGQKRPAGPGSSWYDRGSGSVYHTVGGEIHRYGNSEDLGPSWTIDSENSGLRQIIGNDASYGPYVKSPTEQTGMMKGFNWTDTDEDVSKKEEEILNDIKRFVDNLLAS